MLTDNILSCPIPPLPFPCATHQFGRPVQAPPSRRDPGGRREKGTCDQPQLLAAREGPQLFLISVSALQQRWLGGPPHSGPLALDQPQVNSVAPRKTAAHTASCGQATHARILRSTSLRFPGQLPESRTNNPWTSLSPSILPSLTHSGASGVVPLAFQRPRLAEERAGQDASSACRCSSHRASSTPQEHPGYPALTDTAAAGAALPCESIVEVPKVMWAGEASAEGARREPQA